MFLYNELHQCGIFDQGYTSYRKYEHNTIKAGAAYESFEFRQFIDQNANHSAYLSVSNNTFEKGRIYFLDGYLYDNATASIHLNNNTFGSGSDGIRFSSFSNNTNEAKNLNIDVLNNTIRGRTNGFNYTGGSYIPIGKGAKVRFENNQINRAGRGLYINSYDNISQANHQQQQCR